MARRLAFGVVTKTGSAVVVALTGDANAPQFVGRWDKDLVPEGLPVQPYHAAAGLDHDAAEDLVARVEQAAEEVAVAALRSASDGASVLGVAVVVKSVSVPADVARVLHSHAWMHAAEGLLYREVVLGAARRCGWPAHAVAESELPREDDNVTAMGRIAGRPWRRIEKDATRAALTLCRS